MRVTEEQIIEFKGKYGDLYKVTRRENDYIFRFPSVKEWKEARKKDSTFSTNDKIVSTCLLFPALKELRLQEKSDSYLVEVLGLRLQGEVVREDDGDEGNKVVLDSGKEIFRICRRGTFYDFNFPTRSQWKRISGLISSDIHQALDVLVGDCILDISDQEIREIELKDVSFSEQIGSPFLKLILQDWADSEGKKI